MRAVTAPVRRRSRALAGAALVVGAGLMLAMTGCTTAASDPADTPAPASGHYPVAKAGHNVTTVQTVDEGGYALVSAGEPVDVRLASGASRVTVSGPDVQLPADVPGQPIAGEEAPGTLTVTFTDTTGSIPVSAADFLALDEEQSPESLTPDRATMTASPSGTETLHLDGVFHSGHTTLTWQPAGHPLVTWDFVIEID